MGSKLLILLLSALASQGSMTAWTMTSIKPLLLSVFDRRLRGKSYAEVTDLIHARYGVFGKLLNCPYCLSAWTGLVFYTLFSLLPVSVVLYVTAFFIAPLLLRFTLVVEPYEAVQEETNEVVFSQPEPSYTFTASPEIQQKLNEIRQDPKQHTQFLRDNQYIIGLLYNADQCGDDLHCRQLVHDYHAEVHQMTRANAVDPVACPDCTKGAIINKYVYTLHAHLTSNKQ